MNNWRWDNLRAFGDQVDWSNPQTISSGKVKPTGKRFSWNGSNDCRVMIEPPSCRQYKSGDFLAVRPRHWDEILDKDGDDKYSADHGVPLGGRSRSGNGNDDDDTVGEEDMQGGEIETGKGKGKQGVWGIRKATEDRKGNGKGNGK